MQSALRPTPTSPTAPADVCFTPISRHQRVPSTGPLSVDGMCPQCGTWSPDVKHFYRREQRFSSPPFSGHHSRRGGPERLRRELQRPAARRAPERDPVPLPVARPRRARELAPRLQHRPTPLPARLADPSRPRRHLHQCRPCGNRPPDSTHDWIKPGGNVRAPVRLLEALRIVAQGRTD
jgi:hypothetical protein